MHMNMSVSAKEYEFIFKYVYKFDLYTHTHTQTEAQLLLIPFTNSFAREIPILVRKKNKFQKQQNLVRNSHSTALFS